MKNKADFIDVERIKKEFTELVAIDSVTFQERQMADRLTVKLRELGFEVSEDELDFIYLTRDKRLNGCVANLLSVVKIRLIRQAEEAFP